MSGILIGALCLAIFAIGIGIQITLADKDKCNPFAIAAFGLLPFVVDEICWASNSHKSVRFYIPLSFIWLVIAGYTSWIILNTLDSHSPLSTSKLCYDGLKLLGVFCIWWVQHIFGPTLLASAASWSLYNGIVHGSYSLIPIFGFVTENLLSWGPSWLAEFYTLSSIGYSLVCVVLSFESIDEVLDIFG